jgi:protein-S-isoprenylcysteine O-methyltransferase Ste14
VAAALAAFSAAAAAMVALAFGAAFVIGWAQEGVAERLRASAPTVKRWGGVLLVAVGVWFVLLGIFADAFARMFPVRPPR